MKIRHVVVLLLALAAGGVLALWLAGGKQPPERLAAPEVIAIGRFVEAPVLRVRPTAKGFGVARPGATWQAVSRVSGTVIYRHPELESGTILAAGTRLVEIDPTDYELAIAEAEAQIAGLRAERDQLETDQANIERLLEIERDRLDLAERELDRVRTLVEREAAAASRLDEQETQTLAVRKIVQELENQLNVMPSRRKRLEAETDRNRSLLTRAKRDLGYTTITAPFDFRVADVSVEQDQFAAAGHVLLSADGIELAEVPAQMQLETFRRVVGSLPFGGEAELLSEKIDLTGIDATARLLTGGGATWPARVTRVEAGLDPQIRTAQVVIAVDEPYRSAVPPDRPPLVKNMYVEVELAGQPLAPMAVIPASAVHENTIYVLDSDDRLELRPVEIGFRQNGLAMVAQGLEGGERIIVDDLVPAIAGMRVEPSPAPEILAWIVEAAGGAKP
jgi:multidrug efflux pump subunit AcrA (membrane-fusion protein)